MNVSIDSRELIEGVLFIEKAKDILRNSKPLSGEEKNKMRELYVKQL